LCILLPPEQQEWLHVLKDTLEDLPPSTVTEQTLGLKGIRLTNHVPEKPVALEFQPPKVRLVQLGHVVQSLADLHSCIIV